MQTVQFSSEADLVNSLIEKNLVHSVHTSSRLSFRGCRRRHHWIFVDGYYPTVTPKPLEFGKAFHVGMEKYYDPQTWHDRETASAIAQAAFVQTCKDQYAEYLKLNQGNIDPDAKADYKERIQLGLGMIRYYTKYISPEHDTNFKPVKVEIEFEVPIRSPEGEYLWCKCGRCLHRWNNYWRSQDETETTSTGGKLVDPEDPVEVMGWLGLPVTYGGRIDMLAEDEFGRYWVFDWKTTSRMTGEPGSDNDFMLLDDQITSYCWALWTLGIPVVGFVYVEIKKAVPEEPEPNKVQRLGRWYCVPTDTEILTKGGWKTYDQLVVNEDVLGYNDQKDCLEWTALEAIHLPGEQNVTTFSQRSFRFTATSNHKWIIQRRTGTRTLEPIHPGLGESSILLSSTLDASTLDLSEDEAAYIAWVLTDGSATPGGPKRTSIQAKIYQSKHVKEVQDLLDRLPDSYSRVTIDRGCTVWHLRVPFFRRLWVKAGLDLDLNGWEGFATGLSAKAREAFCRVALLAEGSKNKHGRTWYFPQNRGRKQQLFKLAFFLQGHFPTSDRVHGSEPCVEFSLSLPRKSQYYIRAVDDGRREVWCPQTQLGTWVMRQDGQIAITGNSVNKQIATTYEIYYRTVAENDPQALAAGYYDDFLEYLKSTEGPRFHKRSQIFRSETELENAGRHIWMEAREMTNPNLLVYPSPGRFSCSNCAFQDPCLAKNRGEDYQYTLDTLFQRKDTHYWEERQLSTDTRGGR